MEEKQNNISIRSYAKVNLLLRVRGRLPDGYHELETIFQAISLHDTLVFDFAPSASFAFSLDVENELLPVDARNLVYRACEAFHRRYPLRARVHVRLTKRIPVESGLGGGSSNAAATLIALSRFAGRPLESDALQELAAGLGADVPFFLTGGTALGTGRGDRITPLPDAPPLLALVVKPPVSCSTTEIYRKYDEANLLTARQNSIKIHLDLRPESLTEAYTHIENDLEQVVFALYPGLDSIKRKLLETGAVTAGLSGSGSALFGLFRETGSLERAARIFPDAYRCKFVSRGE